MSSRKSAKKNKNKKKRVPGALVNHKWNMSRRCHPTSEKASTVLRVRNLTAAREMLCAELPMSQIEYHGLFGTMSQPISSKTLNTLCLLNFQNLKNSGIDFLEKSSILKAYRRSQ